MTEKTEQQIERVRRDLEKYLSKPVDTLYGDKNSFMVRFAIEDRPIGFMGTEGGGVILSLLGSDVSRDEVDETIWGEDFEEAIGALTCAQVAEMDGKSFGGATFVNCAE